MALRTQPANSLPQRGAGGRAFTHRRLRWSTRISRRLALYWLLVSVLLATVIMVISALQLRNDPATSREGMAFNIAALSVATGFSVAIGILWPFFWRRASLAALLVPLVLLLGISGNAAAGATVAALLLPTIWLGRTLAAQFDSALDGLDAWVIGTALGIGAIGLLGLALGASGILRPQFVWPVLTIVALCLLARERNQLRRDADNLTRWLRRPVTRQPVLLLLTGIAMGCLWLNLIGALAPEIRPDAVRQRLATAVHFASRGNLAIADPDLIVAKQPALGEIIFAMPIVLGPVQGAKILQWLMGLGCAAAVFALGRRLGGNWAGALAAFAFYHTLLVSYVSQTAYLDHFSALFAIVAILCLTISGGTKWRLAICAGICLGLSVATKLHMGYIAIGTAVTAVILAQRFGWVRSILHTMLLTVAAMLAATPWFVRSYLLLQDVPGVKIAASRLGGAETGVGLLHTTRVTYGYGRSLGDLVAAPFTTVLLSRGYGGSDLATTALVGGHAGFLLLGLIPLIFVLRFRRSTVAITVGAVIGFVFWFFTAPYLRHLLPIMGLLCAVGGSTYVRAWRNADIKHGRITLNVLLIALALMGTFANVALPATAQRLAFGWQSEQSYLAEWLGTSGAGNDAVIQLLEHEPGATRAFAMHDGARLYTSIRISTPWTTGADLAIEGTEEQVLAQLRAGGYSHILIDRMAWWSNIPWDRMTVVNEDFLRRNAELVGGGQNSYLYRLVSPERRGHIAWTTGDELIRNGGFEIAGSTIPDGWAAIGSPQLDTNGAHSRTETGAVLLTERDQLFTQIAVTPGIRYLLGHATRAATTDGGALLYIEWRDSHGDIIGTSREGIPVGSSSYHTHSMLATAPPNAVSATVYAKVFHGNVWFDDFSLRVAALP